MGGGVAVKAEACRIVYLCDFQLVACIAYFMLLSSIYGPSVLTGVLVLEVLDLNFFTKYSRIIFGFSHPLMALLFLESRVKLCVWLMFSNSLERFAFRFRMNCGFLRSAAHFRLL